jgi:hypothetical protein
VIPKTSPKRNTGPKDLIQNYPPKISTHFAQNPKIVFPTKTNTLWMTPPQKSTWSTSNSSPKSTNTNQPPTKPPTQKRISLATPLPAARNPQITAFPAPPNPITPYPYPYPYPPPNPTPNPLPRTPPLTIEATNSKLTLLI